MNRKLIAALMSSAMAASLAAGAAVPVMADDAGTTITIMMSQDWVEDSEQKLAEDFEAETGIHVDYQIIPSDQYQDLLLTRLNSDEGPDIFGTQSGFAIDTTYDVKKNAVPLDDEEWADQYNVFAKEQTSVDGVNYGLTYYDVTTDYYMVYNKKLFEAAGVTEIPTTWDAFEEACQKILDSGVTPIYEPVADGWHQTMLLCENAQVFDKLEPGIIDKLNNNEITFAECTNIKTALDQLNDLAQKGYFGDNFMSDEFVNAEGYMASGEYAISMLKPGAIDAIVASEQNADGYTADDFGLMLLPICDNEYLNVHPTGPTMFIYSGSKNIDAAKQYLSFLMRPESVQYVIDNSTDVQNLPVEVGQTPAYSETTTAFLDSYDTDHQGMVLQDVVKYFNEQWMDISANIAAMFIGEMTSDDVLAAIDEGRAQLAQAAGDEHWN